MAVRALAADKEQILNTETYVSSALAFNVSAYLPEINAGGGATVAVDAEIRVESTGAGSIDLLTRDGRRVGTVGPRSQAVIVARSGTAQSEADSWNFELRPQSPVAVAAAAPAGGVGAAAGGWDTAANRDIAIATINAMRTCLIDAGLMKAE